VSTDNLLSEICNCVGNWNSVGTLQLLVSSTF